MAAAAVATLGLAGFQLIHGLQQSDLISGQAQLQRSIDAMNAEYAELDAWNKENQSLAEVNRYRTQMDQVLSDQKVAMAVNNVDAESGSAAAIVEESKLNGFLNILDAQTAARTSGLQLRREVRSMRMNSDFRAMETENQLRAQRVNTVLSAGSTIASGYNRGYFDTKK